MRVLDLDLDFFLDGIASWPFDDPGWRRDPARLRPWSAAAVAAFLEERCGLRRERPVPGRIVERHDGAFHCWRELVADGRLTAPFEVVHVDAHADLGLGDEGYRYLLCELLQRPVAERTTPDPHHLTEGNYLAFAAACRWLGRLTYVRHPARRHDDVPCEHFRDDRPESGVLQLRRCDPVRFAEDVARGRLAESVTALEPPIPFRAVDGATWCAEAPFDLVILACSPRYTPPTADALVPVVAAYLTPV